VVEEHPPSCDIPARWPPCEHRASSVRTSPPECVRSAFAAGLACYYNGKVDLYLEGELQDRARTKFS